MPRAGRRLSRGARPGAGRGTADTAGAGIGSIGAAGALMAKRRGLRGGFLILAGVVAAALPAAGALQAAGAWCALDGGTSTTPEQISARHQEINAACDTLEALEALSDGPSCQCPAGYRP